MGSFNLAMRRLWHHEDDVTYLLLQAACLLDAKEQWAFSMSHRSQPNHCPMIRPVISNPFVAD
jgi:hypothetical protein